MKLHIFSKTIDDNRGELLGTLNASDIAAKDWEILEKLGVNPENLKVQWCGDYGAHIATTEVDCIVEIEMEVS